MKLYATVTSERATKGQGGNQFIMVYLKVGSASDSKVIATVELRRNETLKLYTLNLETLNQSEGYTVSDYEIEKGKKQKGEKMCPHEGCDGNHAPKCGHGKDWHEVCEPCIPF